MALNYPLRWPEGVERTPINSREPGKFRTGEREALANVRKSLEAFARESGKPLTELTATANQDFFGKLTGGDAAVAVWFTWDGLGVCLAVDRYQTVGANLQALHHIIEARRTELRHGTLTMVRQTFAGFLAIAGPSSPWAVLGIPPGSPADTIRTAYLKLAKAAHSDAGGSDAAMAKLNNARDAALKEVTQ
jgi:hypothetical protein